MNKAKKYMYVATMMAMTAVMTACSGKSSKVVDNIAVEEPVAEEVFTSVGDNRCQIAVDATAYDEWQYIDLSSKTVVSSKVGEAVPAEWDFAVHRFDVKTNGGAAYETDLNRLDGIEEVTVADADYVTDIVNPKIIVDMSGMRSGEVKFAEDGFNECLSRWMDMDLSQMPPSFTLSYKVYILRLKNGEKAALHFVKYQNAAGKLGHITIDCVYPI